MSNNVQVPSEDFVVWTLRSCARRERQADAASRRLTDPDLRAWRSFSGSRLHEGDLVALTIENNAALNPLALRPLSMRPSESEGRHLLERALREAPILLRASSAAFLEAAAVAFGRPALQSDRRAKFDAIRSQQQRILEMPSTAGRVTAAVAEPGAPLETYVGYVVGDQIDEFLIGLTMLEFDRNTAPILVRVAELSAGHTQGLGTFSRAATLGGEEEIINLFPAGFVQQVVTL